MTRDPAALVAVSAAIPAARDLPDPALEFRPGSGRWCLREPYRLQLPGLELFVPAGFESDLASVPRALWPLLAPWELSTVAPVVHDYLYSTGGVLVFGFLSPVRAFDRAGVDGLFLELMLREGVPPVRAQLAHAAVRLFGWRHWRPRAW